VRLAKVERLAGELPRPSWEDHRPRDPLTFDPGASTIDHLIPELPKVGDEAREAVARLSGLILSQQVVSTQKQAAEAARFQRLLTVVGTAVLVPGLVAAVFGANVGFRGRDGVQAFWAMLLFMAASGVGSYSALRSFELGAWSRLAARIQLTRIKMSPMERLLVPVSFALLLAAAGLYVLSR
jgi:hypothetical protein